MSALPRSGRLLPAGFASLALDVITDLLGRNGADAILRGAGLAMWIERPPAPAGEAVDFADLAGLLGALQDTLGLRGARPISLRIGSRAFEALLAPAAAIAELANPSFQALPMERRFPTGLHSLAAALNQLAPMEADARPAIPSLSLHACPECWGRTSSGPSCPLMAGLLTGALQRIAPELELTIEETACRAAGAPACELTIRPAGTD